MVKKFSGLVCAFCMMVSAVGSEETNTSTSFQRYKSKHDTHDSIVIRVGDAFSRALKARLVEHFPTVEVILTSRMPKGFSNARVGFSGPTMISVTNPLETVRCVWNIEQPNSPECTMKAVAMFDNKGNEYWLFEDAEVLVDSSYDARECEVVSVSCKKRRIAPGAQIPGVSTPMLTEEGSVDFFQRDCELEMDIVQEDVGNFLNTDRDDRNIVYQKYLEKINRAFSSCFNL